MSFIKMLSTPENYDRMRAHFEEQAFMRQTSQGQLCAPMIISDTQAAMQSQTNGKVYDSKSEMRKEYRRAGVVEVGNERPTGPTWSEKKAKEAKHKAECKAALAKAHSQMGHGAI